MYKNSIDNGKLNDIKICLHDVKQALCIENRQNVNFETRTDDPSVLLHKNVYKYVMTYVENEP